MTTIGEEARRMAEEAVLNITYDDGYIRREAKTIIESAILKGVKLVLERHSEQCIAELDKVGIASMVGFNRETTRQIIRAMTRELMKELEEKSNG